LFAEDELDEAIGFFRELLATAAPDDAETNRAGPSAECAVLLIVERSHLAARADRVRADVPLEVEHAAEVGHAPAPAGLHGDAARLKHLRLAHRRDLGGAGTHHVDMAQVRQELDRVD